MFEGANHQSKLSEKHAKMSFFCIWYLKCHFESLSPSLLNLLNPLAMAVPLQSTHDGWTKDCNHQNRQAILGNHANEIPITVS